MKKRVHLLAAPSASGGRSRRKTLPVLLLAGVTVFVVVLVFSEGQIQAGYLRYIATPRQYVSHRTTRVPVPRVFTRSASCPQTPTPPSMYHFSKDPRPPPALVSYPGSGSTLTRLLLEMATQVYSGSVYGDFSLYNNSGHQFLGEFNTTNVSVVKTHFPVGPTHGPEFAYKAASRGVILLRDPRSAIPSYLNFIFGDSIGAKHSVQAPAAAWEEWRDASLEAELFKWKNTIKNWTERLDDKHLHIMLYEDLTGSRASGVEVLRSLIEFLDLDGGITDDAISCVWEEILGRKAHDKGIRRSKNYVPAYTAAQHSMITSELEAFADFIGGNAKYESALAEAIRRYAAKIIPANEMAAERKIPPWPPANCEIPSAPATFSEDGDGDYRNSICPNGTKHSFDCHISVCAVHLIPQQVERYSQTNLHEPHESKLFAALMLSARADDLFVDVGAAVGYFAALALRVNPRALVYAFDPLIDFREKLERNIWLNFGHRQNDTNTSMGRWEAEGTSIVNRVCVDGRAMSQRDGEKDWIGDDYGGQIKTKVEKDGFGEIVGGNEVDTVRLDTVLKSIGRDPFLLMMDIQGMERYILNSSFGVLQTGQIKILAIGIHENSLEECRAMVERSGAYTVVVAESEVPLQPDGVLIAVAKEWLRAREIIEMIMYAISILDEDYDSFLAATKSHIRGMG